MASARGGLSVHLAMLANGSHGPLLIARDEERLTEGLSTPNHDDVKQFCLATLKIVYVRILELSSESASQPLIPRRLKRDIMYTPDYELF